MAINSYQTLKDAVIATAEDDSVEFAVFIDTAIDIAEVRLAREIDTLGMTLTATVTAASASSLLTKPVGYKNGQDLWFINTSTSERVVLKKKPYSYVLDYWPVASSVGVPKYYADVDTSTFIIAPTANTSIAMTLRYEGRPAALTSANPTNYFIDQCSDALFFAVMVEMSRFSRNTTQEQLYEQKYTNARDTLINEGRRQRMDNTGMPQNAATNTLKGDV